MKLTGDQKDEIDSLLDKLSEAGRGSRPLKSPLLMGDYEVAYTSTQRAGTQNGQPSGGRFRGAIGRMLFQTTGLFQSILPGDSSPVAVNKVCIKISASHTETLYTYTEPAYRYLDRTFIVLSKLN